MFGRIARVVGNLFTVVDDKPSNRVRLGLTQLEDRATPATFVVDSVGDFSDEIPGDGKAGRMMAGVRVPEFKTSLRSAIEEGNALMVAGNGNDHAIQFDMETMTGNPAPTSIAVITLIGSALPMTKANFFIEGLGRGRLTVERSLIAQSKHHIMLIGTNSRVVGSNLTITDGYATGQGYRTMNC